MSDDSRRIIAQVITLLFALPTLFYTVRAFKHDLSIKDGFLYSVCTTIFLSYFMI